MCSAGPCHCRDRSPHLERKIMARFYFQECEKTVFSLSVVLLASLRALFLYLWLSSRLFPWPPRENDSRRAHYARMNARVRCEKTSAAQWTLPTTRRLSSPPPGPQRSCIIRNTNVSLQSCPAHYVANRNLISGSFNFHTRHFLLHRVPLPGSSENRTVAHDRYITRAFVARQFVTVFRRPSL